MSETTVPNKKKVVKRCSEFKTMLGENPECTYIRSPDWLMALPDLGYAAKALYSVLLSYANPNGITKIRGSRLGQHLGVGKAAVGKTAKTLIRSGLLACYKDSNRTVFKLDLLKAKELRLRHYEAKLLKKLEKTIRLQQEVQALESSIQVETSSIQTDTFSIQVETSSIQTDTDVTTPVSELPLSPLSVSTVSHTANFTEASETWHKGLGKIGNFTGASETDSCISTQPSHSIKNKKHGNSAARPASVPETLVATPVAPLTPLTAPSPISGDSKAAGLSTREQLNLVFLVYLRQAGCPEADLPKYTNQQDMNALRTLHGKTPLESAQALCTYWEDIPSKCKKTKHGAYFYANPGSLKVKSIQRWLDAKLSPPKPRIQQPSKSLEEMAFSVEEILWLKPWLRNTELTFNFLQSRKLKSTKVTVGILENPILRKAALLEAQALFVYNKTRPDVEITKFTGLPLPRAVQNLISEVAHTATWTQLSSGASA